MSHGTPHELVLEAELDRGGGWIVYLAHSGPLVGEARVLATVDEEVFQREVERLRQFKHPNLPRLCAVGTYKGGPYLLVDHAGGPSLQGFLARRGPLPWAQVLDLARPLASALKFAHDRGISLGEISLHTLVFATEPDPSGPLPTVRIAAFPPPAGANEVSIGPRGEVHGLGRVLVGLLTGKEPDRIRPLAGLPKDVPTEFRVFLERVLDADPERRPTDGNTLCRQLDKVRGSLAEPAPSEAEVKEAEAALVSKYVREELDAQNKGGPVQRFFNSPWVVLPLFLLCVGTLVWTFWPLSREGMYARGAELMNSDDPADWTRAFSDYFDPMLARFPDRPEEPEVKEFRNRLARSEEERAAARAARHAAPMTEAQAVYQQALRARQIGDELRARELWQALIAAFGSVSSEGPWIRLARQRLDEDAAVIARTRKLQPVRDARETVRRLRAEGKVQQADTIERGLDTLYRDDPQARMK